MQIKKRQIPEALQRAVQLQQYGALEQAATLLQAIIKVDPRQADALHILGLLKGQSGLIDDAIMLIRKAVAADNKQADYYNSLGVMLRKAGQLHEAEKAYQRCLQRDPEHLEARSNLGTLLRHQKRYDEAVIVCRQVARRTPDDIKARINLGGALYENGNLREAEEQFLYALNLRPSQQVKASLYTNLANMYWTLGDAAQCSHYRRLAADLSGQFTDKANQLLVLNYLPVTAEELAQAYRDATPKLADKQLPAPSVASTLPEKRLLRIGYLSPDLVDHPVGWLLAPVLAHHDQSRFTVIAYDVHRGERPALDCLTSSVSLWRDCRTLSVSQVADCIQQDAIDILIDLAGHTGPIELFKQKVAPLQITWLGYFHTTCLPTIAWILADPISIPAGEEHRYTEKVFRLPFFRFCFQQSLPAPQVATPPCIHNGYVTFGSFNNPLKLTDQVIDTWARLLHSLPDSRLLLRWSTFSLQDVRHRLMHSFAERGIRAERLMLLEGLSHAELLAAYAEIDIALDPFPFCGGMTSLEALWMGVPVITLAGDRMAGRQTQAFLGLAGHPELITTSTDGYIGCATELAADTGRLQTLRNRLRADLAASPLCDCSRFTKDLEAAYCKLWKEMRVAE